MVYLLESFIMRQSSLYYGIKIFLFAVTTHNYGTDQNSVGTIANINK